LEFCIKVNGKDLRKLLDTQWTNGDSEAVKETMGVIAI
jgi:hypothetical protein